MCLLCMKQGLEQNCSAGILRFADFVSDRTEEFLANRTINPIYRRVSLRFRVGRSELILRELSVSIPSVSFVASV